MTTLAEERAEQERWHKLAVSNIGTVIDSLMNNEFVEPQMVARWSSGMLLSILQHAAAEIPYYRDLFAACRVTPEDLAQEGGLAALPLLTKNDVYDNAERLRTDSVLKAGEGEFITATSGTTGRPTHVHHTRLYSWLFCMLKQREYRWFRFHPEGALASLRLASQLPKLVDIGELPDGRAMRLRAWPQMEDHFRTGPFIGFSITNPIAAQIALLRQERPDYLVSYSESLEHLAYTCGDEKPCDSLKGLLAISEQLTPAMRRHIEKSFNAPVQQNYGLNEIGLVAVRCEAGRYHVHVENCLVELLDESGAPQKPGRAGRIVVTAIRNRRMPLIRYDTDDLAEVVAGDCPCGRTLPAFGAIMGRYSRIAYLPEGTLGRVGAIRSALEAIPSDLSRNLRRFQVHQYKNNTFELRLGVAAPLPRGFAESVQAAWNASAPAESAPLAIIEVSDIPRTPGGKFQDFTSDFVPKPEEEDAAPPGDGG